MEDWMSFISVIISLSALIAFVTIFIKMGREKGESDAHQEEMRKDIENNAKDINNLGSKINHMEVENTKLITTLSNDLSWIKASLTKIDDKLSKKEG